MLAVAGLLDRTVGGQSVPIAKRDASHRRTIYLEQKRSDLPFVQQLFDAPSTLTCCGRRRNSTVALQPLYLLNDTRLYRYAEAFAQRVASEAGSDRRAQIDRAFQVALGRLPREEEYPVLEAFFEQEKARTKPVSHPKPPETKSDAPAVDERLVHFCHSLMNLNEFLYIP